MLMKVLPALALLLVAGQRNAPVPLVLAEAGRCMLTELRITGSSDPIRTGHQTKRSAAPNRSARQHTTTVPHVDHFP